MALRVRKNGDIVCAKYHKAKEGDICINDKIHEWMAGASGHLDSNPIIGDYDEKKHIWKILRD